MILVRASALSVRSVLALTNKLVSAGRPDFRLSVVLVPLDSDLTCYSLDISASISTAMSSFMPAVLRITHRVDSDTESHCSNSVQLVPPSGSYLGEPPFWSLQKPRSPVLPTASGTAVTV